MNLKVLHAALFLSVSLAAPTAVLAQDNNWRIVAGLGLGGGAEKITSGTITNIDTNAVVPFEIRPGDGAQIRLGAEYALGADWAVQATVGHSAVAPMGMNGSLTFTTIPVEVIGFMNLGKGLRLGVGVRKAHAEMAGSGVASNSPVLGIYETSMGTVAEVQYLFADAARSVSANRSQFGISARHVSETYQRNGYSFNGNHYEIGIVLYY